MRIRGYTLNHTVYGGQVSIPVGDLNINMGAMYVEPDPTSAEKFEPESYENYQYEPDIYRERYYTASIVGAWGTGGFSLTIYLARKS